MACCRQNAQSTALLKLAVIEQGSSRAAVTEPFLGVWVLGDPHPQFREIT
jgi:hypothetical protein